MADPKTHRLSPADRQADLDAFAALSDLKSYAPANAKFTVAEVTTAKTAMETAQKAEITASNALDAARDNAAAAEHAFHQKMLGVKRQVGAQYGEDSNEIQSLGLKKKSEYSKPAVRAKTRTAAAAS